jgi:choline dehydrogenase-like flavoprotein
VTSEGVIVVGSGASATSAAFPLLRSGVPVTMLDVGNVDQHYAPLIPDAPFSELRRDDSEQFRYFLGDDFEGVPFGDVRVGAQLTPPRRFIARDTERFTPVRTNSFGGMESLAKGGLGSGWGAVAVEWDDEDLADFPIKRADLAPHYEAVSKRIGISGARDDLLSHYGDPSSLQPALELDSNGSALLGAYEKKRSGLNRAGIFVGRARLAVLSKDLGSRSAQRYHDMDFYADKDKSVFRPSFAVDELTLFPSFSYRPQLLVRRFRDLGSDGVEVEASHTETGRSETFRARKLILAAGTLGSARIALRSLDRYDVPIPIVSNPYTYVPCALLPTLGKKANDRRHSLTQVAVMLESKASGQRVHAQIYSYRSLLLFKIAKEAPLAVPTGFRIMRELMSCFVIVGIHHRDSPTAAKHCQLRRAEGDTDVLEISYHDAPDTQRRQVRDEKTLLRGLRKLGCWPLKRINPGNGSSIHYGGTLPMAAEERPLTVTPQGRLRGTSSVFVADGSTFPSLPAKALTLSLMANAERIGTLIAKELS